MTSALSAHQARDIVRSCCDEPGRLVFTDHARQRMRQRGIGAQQVVRCLRKGRLVEGPARSPKGDWKCTFSHIAAGERIEVAVAIDLYEQPVVTVIVTTY